MLILFEDLSQSLQVLYRYIYIKTLSDRKGLNLHQFILHIAQSDLFRMAQSSQPVRIRVHHVELVMTAQIIVLMSGRKAVTRVQYRSLDDHISACFIQSHRVCRSQNTEVGDNGGIIMIPTVSFRRYVHYKTDVEVGLIFHYGQ